MGVEELSEDEIKTVTASCVMHVTELFQKFDSDHDGHITYDELKVMWEQMAYMWRSKYPSKEISTPTEEEAGIILASLDDDDNGSLEKSEFVDWISTGMTRTASEREE